MPENHEFGSRLCRSLSTIASLRLMMLAGLLAWTFLPSQSASAAWPAEMSAGNIRCHANFPLEPYRGLLSEISALQEDLSQELGVSAAREPVYLYLFHDQSVYKSYLGRYFPEVPYRRALFMKSRGPGMVFAHLHEDFAVDLRHESTHALLHATLPMVPLWLDEGLAEYFEFPPDQRATDNPHQAPVKRIARQGQIPKIEQLEELRELADMGRGEYRDAWAWVHFMMHGPPAAREELMRFLADLEAHVPPGKLSTRLRRRVPKLEQAINQHFLNWQSP